MSPLIIPVVLVGCWMVAYVIATVVVRLLDFTRLGYSPSRERETTVTLDPFWQPSNDADIEEALAVAMTRPRPDTRPIGDRIEKRALARLAELVP